MANNRMFLLHKPSKLGIMIGKHLSAGWYQAPEKEELERFYDHLWDESGCGFQDDDELFLITEDSDDWQLTTETDNGFCIFLYKEGRKI